MEEDTGYCEECREHGFRASDERMYAYRESLKDLKYAARRPLRTSPSRGRRQERSGSETSSSSGWESNGWTLVERAPEGY